MSQSTAIRLGALTCLVVACTLTQAQASQHRPPEQAMRGLLVMLGLERQGRQRELIEHRKALRVLSGALYGLYMARR